MRDRQRETERETERRTERRTARKKIRQRKTRNRHGVDIIVTNVTAATVPKLGVTSSRVAFEEKRGKERDRQKERDRKRESERRDRKRVKSERE